MNHDAFKTVSKYLTTFVNNQYYDFSVYRDNIILRYKVLGIVVCRKTGESLKSLILLTRARFLVRF